MTESGGMMLDMHICLTSCPKDHGCLILHGLVVDGALLLFGGAKNRLRILNTRKRMGTRQDPSDTTEAPMPHFPSRELEIMINNDWIRTTKRR